MHRTCPLLGVKRTCRFAPQMSAFDPKRTSSRPHLPWGLRLRVGHEATRVRHPAGLPPDRQGDCCLGAGHGRRSDALAYCVLGRLLQHFQLMPFSRTSRASRTGLCRRPTLRHRRTVWLRVRRKCPTLQPSWSRRKVDIILASGTPSVLPCQGRCRPNPGGIRGYLRSCCDRARRKPRQAGRQYLPGRPALAAIS